MQKKTPGKRVTPSQTHTYKSSPGLPGNWMTKSSKYQKVSPVKFNSAPIAQVRKQNPNSPAVMQKTLDLTKRGGYKGAKWIK